MKYACITLDIEPDLLSSDYGIELFSDHSKLNLFKSIIDKYDAKITGFVVTELLQKNPILIENALKSLPLQCEVHSYTHNPQETDSEREIDESIKWYSKFFGFSPKGYRAPYGLITHNGIKRLAERGFTFDASIFPSFRFDKYAYYNMNLPIKPYVYKTKSKNLIELPFAVIPKIRLVVSLSYIKLFGLRFYQVLINLFGLPPIVIFNSHPHDFFIKSHLHRVRGFEKWALARNSEKAIHLFDEMLNFLQIQGYKFIFIEHLLNDLDIQNLKQISLNT